MALAPEPAQVAVCRCRSGGRVLLHSRAPRDAARDEFAPHQFGGVPVGDEDVAGAQIPPVGVVERAHLGLFHRDRVPHQPLERGDGERTLARLAELVPVLELERAVDRQRGEPEHLLLNDALEELHAAGAVRHGAVLGVRGEPAVDEVARRAHARTDSHEPHRVRQELAGVGNTVHPAPELGVLVDGVYAGRGRCRGGLRSRLARLLGRRCGGGRERHHEGCEQDHSRDEEDEGRALHDVSGGGW